MFRERLLEEKAPVAVVSIRDSEPSLRPPPVVLVVVVVVHKLQLRIMVEN